MLMANTPRLGAVLAAAVGLAALAGCERKPAPAAPAAPALPPASNLPPPSVQRADLLGAIDAARAAYAAGEADPSATLAGRRFSVRQAFGCAGPAAAAPPGQARWAWDRAHKAIEISLTPADWTTAPVLAGPNGAGGGWEAVEGFWLTWPWLRGDACPAPPMLPVTPAGETPPPAPPAAAPHAGLAAVFAAGGSRIGRRDGRAYAFTLRGEPTAEIPLGGYRLLIEGRLTAFPDGRVIRCRAASADAEPVCIAAAEVDRVAVEDAGGKLLREWRPG